MRLRTVFDFAGAPCPHPACEPVLADPDDDDGTALPLPLPLPFPTPFGGPLDDDGGGGPNPPASASVGELGRLPSVSAFFFRSFFDGETERSRAGGSGSGCEGGGEAMALSRWLSGRATGVTPALGEPIRPAIEDTGDDTTL
jgi:hypothetical protein